MGDLLRCCAALESERQTERKQAASKISKFIKDADVQATLDNGKRNKRISWSTVIRSLAEYVFMEAENIRDSSKLTPDTVKKRIKDLTEVFCTAIQYSEKRGPQLEASDVYKHVSKMLGDDTLPEYIRINFVNDYTTMLVRHVMPVQLHRNDMSQRLYKDFIEIYTRLLLHTEVKIDRGLIMQTISLLMEVAKNLPTFVTGDLFQFFKEIIKDTRNSKTSGLLESCLRALNTFSKACALDCRGQLCQLGEEISFNVLSLWNKSGIGVKDQIIDFMAIQLTVHNPNGCLFTEDSENGTGSKTWKDCIYKLYDCLLNELQQIADRIQRTGTELSQKQSFISLAVDCFNQVICYQKKDEMTSLCSDPCRKRSKMETCWSQIADGISSVTNAKACVAWCQLFISFLEKYKSTFPINEYEHFLQALHQAQKDSKRSDVLMWILKGLKSLCTITIPSKPDKLKETWIKVWIETLKVVNFQGAEEQSFELLTQILNYELVDPDAEMFRGFRNGNVRPSSGSVVHLLTLLTKARLPINRRQFKGRQSTLADGDKYSLQKQLLSWIIPSSAAFDTIAETEKVFSHFQRDSYTAFANLCMALISKSPSAYASFSKSVWENRKLHDTSVSVRSWYETVPDVLQLSLVRDPSHETVQCFYEVGGIPERKDDKYHDAKSLLGRCSPIEDLAKYMIETLRDVTNYFKSHDMSSPSVKSGHVAFASVASKFTSFLLECLCVSRARETPPSTFTENLLSIVTTQLKNLEVLISDLASNAHIEVDLKSTTVLKILTEMKDSLYRNVSRTINDERRSGQAKFKFTFPAGIITFLVNLCNKNLDATSTPGYSLNHSLQSDDSTMEFDDFDDQIHSEGSGQSRSSYDFSPSGLSRTGSFSVQRTSWHISEQIRLTAYSILTMIAHSSCCDKNSNSLAANFLQSFGSEGFDPSEHLHIDMIISQVELMLYVGSKVAADDIQIILEALRQIVSTNRNDQDICHYALAILSQVLEIIHICQISMEELNEGKAIIRKIISAFWSLKNNKYCPIVRQQLAKNITLLIKLDPEGNWAIIEQIQRKKVNNPAMPQEMEVADLLPSLLKDESHLVRIFVAERLGLLFRSGWEEQIPTDPIRQLEAFQRGDLHDAEADDISKARTVTILIGLKSVMLSSSICERDALFFLLASYRDNFLNRQLSQQVLKDVAIQRGHSSVANYIFTHLSYLIQTWIRTKRKILEFPACLFEMTIGNFLREFSKDVTPPFFYLGLKEGLTEISTKLGLTEGCSQLVLDCFPKIASFVLPAVVAIEDLCDTASRTSWQFLQSYITVKKFHEMLQSSFSEIFINILLLLYDRDSSFIRDTDPEPVPCSYTNAQFHRVLNYLVQNFGPKETLHTVLKKRKDGYQNILLQIAQTVEIAKGFREKIRLLCAYRLFVSFCVDDLTDGVEDHTCFVLRDIIHRLLHWLDSWPDCFDILMDILKTVCLCAANSVPLEFGKYLYIIVNSIIKHVANDDEEGRKALDLLQNLLIDKRHDLAAWIKDAYPLPDIPQFQRINTVLRESTEEEQCSVLKNVQSYLSKRRTYPTVISIECLKKLRRNIRNKHLEIKRLVLQAEENKKIFYTVAHDLLLVASNHFDGGKKDIAIGFEAARCLADLTIVGFTNDLLYSISQRESLPFPNVTHPSSSDSKVRLQFLYCPIIYKIHHYLIDRNIDVVSAATKTLKELLQTATGASFLSVYDAADSGSVIPYIQPFLPDKRKKNAVRPAKQTLPTLTQFTNSIDRAELWAPGHLNFDEWVIKLSAALISSGAVQDDILILLKDVAERKADFAEFLLPFVFHDVLLQGDEMFSGILSGCVNRYFECYVSTYVTKTDPSSKERKASVDKGARSLIKVINYLRKQNRAYSGRGVPTPWRNNFWLNIDYLQLAQVATGCHSYFAASLFCEIWFESQADPVKGVQGSQDTPLKDLNSEESDKNYYCRNILLKAYRELGETDAMYGVGAGTIPEIPIRIQTYQHEGDYVKALLAQDLCHGGLDLSDVGVSTNLGRLGLNHVMMLYAQATQSTQNLDSELREFQFEAAWKNSVWNLEPEASSTATTYSGGVYSSLLSLQDENHDLFERSVLQAANACFKNHFQEENEDWHQFSEVLSRMSALSSLYQFGVDFFRRSFSTAYNLNLVTEADFGYYEHSFSLMTTACQCVLRSKLVSRQEDAIPILKVVYDHLLHSSRLARDAKLFQLSEHELFELRKLEKDYTLPKTWKLEEAKMFWDRGEWDLGMHQLKSLLRETEKESSDQLTILYPEALGVYGTWLAESRSENPTVIIEQYLDKSVTLMEEAGFKQDEVFVERYWTLAKYASLQYQNTRLYLKSPTFENKKLVIKKAKEEMARLQELHGTTNIPKGSRYWANLQSQCQEDEEEVRVLLEDQRFFLYKAIGNYLKCFRCGDKYDVHILMLCSLWLNNSSDPNVNNMMKNEALKIQSRKYLPLMYQLAARLGSIQHRQTPEFKEALEKIIEKAAVEHPFHVTYVILALCNADIEQTTSAGKRRAKTEAPKQSPENQERTLSAKQILESIRNRKGKVLKQMEELVTAYNELAYWDILHLKREVGSFELPSKLLIRRLTNLNLVPIPTITTQVDPSCQYCDIVHITKFDPQFTHCGGVNLPKVLELTGSDGKKRRQLVKGQDDLRQDAVMQQVFGIVNQLLRGQKETRNLKIRTYKVVPLSQRSGLVEWCEGTMPLGDYLIGSRKTGKAGAHSRYCPKEWTSMECRKKLAVAAFKLGNQTTLHSTSSNDITRDEHVLVQFCAVSKSQDATSGEGKKSKLNVFKEIMKNFSPVFRHFLLEKFPDPAEWFSRRVTYTRSCATCSIVGYILGLGDRHIQNMLIDCNSAELVHIDLGVAFEQGKVLPTPETVPFRLTRDLVDGMGISGVEGIFRRCCNRTLKVMRNSQEAISTIVEVLLYDPLYAWTLSPVKALELQRKAVDLDTTDMQPTTAPTTNMAVDVLDEVQTALNANENRSKNKMAERVLIRLKQKLDGNENGSFLSVEGQVNYLIQEARDIKNLCRLFPGWQPWV